MNSINLVGRLTKDVSVTISDKGTNIGRFVIAVNRPFAKEGQQQADFINCVAFGKTALNLSEYCGKGSLISMNGKVQSFSYEKDGERVFGMNIVAENIQYLETRNKNDNHNPSVNDNNNVVPASEGTEINADDELPY